MKEPVLKLKLPSSGSAIWTLSAWPSTSGRLSTTLAATPIVLLSQITALKKWQAAGSLSLIKITAKRERRSRCSLGSESFFAVLLCILYRTDLCVFRLPCRFIVQGHYGILSNRSKGEALQAARQALGAEALPLAEQREAIFNPLLPKHFCFCCGTTTTHLLMAVLSRDFGGGAKKAL